MEISQKKAVLHQRMEHYAAGDIVLAFSGGVDSSLLLWLACEHAAARGTRVYAVTIHTMLHPVKELEQCRNMAEEAGAVPRIITVDELLEAGIENNPENRCYLCKKCMFQKLLLEAEQLGAGTVMEGTNLEDTREYRPGIRALKELKISSPLLEAGFTKAEVRQMAAEYGISSAQKPSVPCLATRFPYNTALAYEELQKVEQLEELLRSRGFYNVRARIHGNLVRLEVDTPDLVRLMQNRKEIIMAAKQLGYLYVSADLEGFRSGSQDLLLKNRTDI